MFDNLTERFTQTLKKISGQGRLTDDNIQEALGEVRTALLEADVALPVVKEFTTQVKQRAVGQEVVGSLTPGQTFIKVVYDELVTIMGQEGEPLSFATQPPAVILMAGLQGAGKTTTVAKLARWIRENEKRSVMVASADVYRPAAIEQLQTLAADVGVDFFPSDPSQHPIDIARGAIDLARRKYKDVLILDTAGRLHVDEEMMDEIRQLHATIKPIETLFVVDAMTGQDAANTAKAFGEALDLTGVILTKADGDARGGAALSVRYITGKPIKFIGMGEKSTALERFHPNRIASRILGMGDILTLAEEVERNLDKAKAEGLMKKLQKGKPFNLDDYYEQLMQLQRMGGMMAVMEKLPFMSGLPQDVKSKVNDKEVFRHVAIIQSMTRQERSQPEIINPSRKNRIARGAGIDVQELNTMLKQFEQIRKMMKTFKKKNLLELFKGAKGKLPKGGMPPMPPGRR